MGHRVLNTTMDYTHFLNHDRHGISSRADTLKHRERLG
jgi:hypothetical protein